MREGSVLPFFYNVNKEDIMLEKHGIYELKNKEKHVIYTFKY